MRGTNYHISRQFSFVSYLLVLALLFSSSIWPIILSKPNKASATAGNLHLFWTGASAPDGWTIISDGGGEDFYQKFLKGSGTYGSTGGSATHTHTFSAAIQETGSTGRNTRSPGITINALNHASGHGTVTDACSTADNLPTYRQLKVIEYTTGGVPSTIPAGAIAIFDAAAPSGWTSVSGDGGNYNQKFVRASDDATTASGSASHTHTMSTQSISAAGAGTFGVSGLDSIGANGLHTHTITSNSVASLSRSNYPPYIDVVLASKDSDGAAPVGMIGWFDDTPAYGWTVISDTGGAFNGQYIRGNTSYNGTSAGSAQHNHTATGGESDVYVASDVPSGYTTTGTGGTLAAAWGGHTHAVLYNNFNNVANDPPYITVIFAKKTAVYFPQINNWRWYADEEDTTPGTAYEAENTAPPQIEMGKSIGFKLRINFAEADGVAGNNSRKSIQYATSTAGPWTAVGEPADTDQVFRYYDGGGDDNGTLASTLITGSSGTYKGIHDESNSSAPSNADQPASTTVEFEYCIENYKAPANTLFYFNFSDEIAGTVPLASGKSYPSLTTASAYDLTLSAPSTVAMGDWAAGSSPYASYTFVTNEEITIRDNRGQTDGNSSGWSCTAEMSTELIDVVAPSSITDPVFTGSGLNDMTIDGGSDFTGTVTTYYKVEIDGTGFPNTFKWSDDGGSTWDATGVSCGGNKVLNNGVLIDFANVIGHTLGDYWTFTGNPEVSNTIPKEDMYFITNTITGLYDAATTGISGNSGEYMSSAVTAATVAGSGKQGLGGFQFKPTLRVYNAGVAGTYEGSITFTLT